MNTLEKLVAIGSIALAATTVNAQDVNFLGRVVNNSQQGLEGKKVEVYFNQGGPQTIYMDSTDVNGYFNANNIIDVKEEQTQTK